MIRGITIDTFEGERRGTRDVRIVATLTDEEIGVGLWRGGKTIAIETTGPGDRAHIEMLLKYALDELEKP
jgi:hypothetical protein